MVIKKKNVLKWFSFTDTVQQRLKPTQKQMKSVKGRISAAWEENLWSSTNLQLFEQSSVQILK